MLTDLGRVPTTARFRGIFRNRVEYKLFFSSAGCNRAEGMVVKIAVAHLQRVMYHLQSSAVIRGT